MKQKKLQIEAINFEVGQRIAALRAKMNKTQADFAKILGITRGKLSQLEIGRVSIKISDLRNVVTKCSTTYDYLIDGKSSDSALMIAAEPEVESYKRKIKISKLAQELGYTEDDLIKVKNLADELSRLVKTGDVKGLDSFKN